MSRCRSCNRKLFEVEMSQKKVNDPDSYEDMCNICKGAASSQYNYTEEKQYHHSDLVDGMTPQKNPKY